MKRDPSRSHGSHDRIEATCAKCECESGDNDHFILKEIKKTLVSAMITFYVRIESVTMLNKLLIMFNQHTYIHITTHSYLAPENVFSFHFLKYMCVWVCSCSLFILKISNLLWVEYNFRFHLA